MAERGKARYAFLSAGSNNVIATRPITLYSVHGTGGVVRIDDAHRFPQGVLDLNASSSNTVGHFTPPTVFAEGLGLDTGLVAAFATASNSGITIEWE